MTGVVDGRATPGAAVISSRRAKLSTRLLSAGVGARFILPQTSEPGAQIPPLRPPLLLDTTALDVLTSAAFLLELTGRRPPIATVALARPDDHATQAILSICPAVYAVVADTDDLRVLAPLIRLGGLCDETRLDMLGPYWIGLPPPDRPPITMSDLRILVALSQATSFEDAAARAAISLRTFYRRLAQLRAGLGLPPATFATRAEEVVATTVAALANPDWRSPSASPRLRDS